MVTSAPQLELRTAAPRKSRRPFPKVIAIIAWQVIAVLFVEAVLYWAGLGEEEIFRLDERIGFTHMANKRITWRQEGPGTQSCFNRDGMREPGLTIAKPTNTYRIALLGDSMVESLQVPIEKTFGQILGSKLSNNICEPYAFVQVINFGTSGYSTVQEYLQLKDKVMKYNPNLVILGYSNRDLYENWSVPDQQLANVRPCALHLPGSPLVIDDSPVRRWMKTPRGRFLKELGWLREHSRIWGLISAAEMQWGFHNPGYRAIIDFLAQPNKSLSTIATSLSQLIRSIPSTLVTHNNPSFQIQFFEAASPVKQVSHSVLDDAMTQSSIRKAPDKIPVGTASDNINDAKQLKGKKTFLDLMSRTLASLLLELNRHCLDRGVKFCIMALPCRDSLVPSKSGSNDKFALSYPQEIAIVSGLCRKHSIPFLDSESAAEKLQAQERVKLLYFAHLSPRGHDFLASELYPFILKQMR